MTIVMRSARPLHLCYESEPDAAAAFAKLDDDLSRAPEGALITVVQDPWRRVAFLKRDFRSLELWRNDEDGEDGVPGDDGRLGETLPLPSAPQSAKRGQSVSRATLEAGLNDIITSLGRNP